MDSLYDKVDFDLNVVVHLSVSQRNEIDSVRICDDEMVEEKQVRSKVYKDFLTSIKCGVKSSISWYRR